jgi:hypothetical protein
VASALTALSGPDMIEGLIAGERDPPTLADLARGRVRSKIPGIGERTAAHSANYTAMALAVPRGGTGRALVT